MKIFLITCSIAFIFTSAWGQNKSDTIKTPALCHNKSDTIKNIDRKVLSINRETKYQIATLKNEAFLDTAFINQPGKGYGQLTGYYKNDTVYKIREFIGISQLHDMAITEYYFSGSKLIFIKETEEYGPENITDSLGAVDHKKNKADFEGQYYFFNDKIINTNKKGEQKILPKEMYFDSQSKEGQLLLSAKKYVSLLTKKD